MNNIKQSHFAIQDLHFKQSITLLLTYKRDHYHSKALNITYFKVHQVIEKYLQIIEMVRIERIIGSG